MPPMQANGYFPNNYFAQYINTDHGMNPVPSASTSNSVPATPGSIAGRKRSRGNIFDEDEDGPLEDGSIVTPINGEMPQPRGKPVYGPGMTLMYPDEPGYQQAAESQSGTWVEERAERKQFQFSHNKRPSISSRKSQRKSMIASGPDDLAQLVLPPQIREATTEPLIDEATRTLGISWKRMDANEASQIVQAAYSKWIQNHYPSLQDVVVWFENSALPGYLVEARNVYSGQQVYYIFSHDLHEARLVTTEPAQLVPRLKLLPALHLAAPGGHLSAELDPVLAGLGETNGEQESAALKTDAGCSAHAMELD
ncbi:hypothetical protein BAUCODRAFT_80955 [Baudoinia panamericana UAMH 10762]|uniref:Uncharacterized protein n=1 Tax=Baudoinia panamericana (strain UAMH 10762) TaxID=717646 RepID=M2MU61_BAUPA|nr:uncharacterized protein BAUCODRAFT_80955 [Baudoinia panamericana UAMH 10762]EMD00462.1 hypothetical protein BAUCODRAFT_80955 [Baudoinia panamericana UAMH 10762]